MATVINLGMERCPIAEFAVPFIDANGPLGKIVHTAIDGTS